MIYHASVSRVVAEPLFGIGVLQPDPDIASIAATRAVFFLLLVVRDTVSGLEPEVLYQNLQNALRDVTL